MNLSNRFGTREKVQKERNFVFVLFSIVLTFFSCHVLSVLIDFFELIHVNQVKELSLPFYNSQCAELLATVHSLHIADKALSFLATENV
jgi:hypothetical protein